MARMARGNPMDDLSVRAKMQATVVRQFASGRVVSPPIRPLTPYVLAVSTQRPRQPKLDTPGRVNMSKRMSIDNPMHRPDVAQRQAETLRQRYRDGTLLPPSRAVSSAQERQLFDVFVNGGLPVIHSGGRTFWIGPCVSGRRRNPDMRHLTERRAILFSGRYWHTAEDIETQLQDYQSAGWAVLHFWEESLTHKSLARALAAEFLASGSVSSQLPPWALVRSIRSVSV